MTKYCNVYSDPISLFIKCRLKPLSSQGGTSHEEGHLKANARKYEKPFTHRWRGTSHVPCAICMWRHATSVRKVLCTSGCTFSKDVPRATCHLDVKATYEGYIPGGDAAAKRLSWASQNRKVSPSPSIKPRSPGTVTSREETIGVKGFSVIFISVYKYCFHLEPFTPTSYVLKQ